MESSVSISDKQEALTQPGVYRGRVHISTKRQRQIFTLCLVFVDSLILASTLFIDFVERFILQVFHGGPDLRPQFYVGISLVIIPFWLAVFWLCRLYDWHVLFGGTREYSLIFQSCLICFVSIAVAQFFIEDLVIARGWLGLIWLLSLVSVGIGRFTMRRVAYFLRRHGYLTSPALMIGANDEGRALGEQVLSWPTSGLHVLGYLDEKADPGMVVCKGLTGIGPLYRIEEYVRKYNVEELLIATSALSRTYARRNEAIKPGPLLSPIEKTNSTSPNV